MSYPKYVLLAFTVGVLKHWLGGPQPTCPIRHGNPQWIHHIVQLSFRSDRPKLDKFRPEFRRTWAQIWSKSAKIGRTRPKLAEIGQSWLNSDQIWSASARLIILCKNWARIWPNLADKAPIWSKPARFGRNGPKLEPTLAEPDQMWSKFGRGWPKFGPIWAKFGRIRRNGVRYWL